MREEAAVEGRDGVRDAHELTTGGAHRMSPSQRRSQHTHRTPPPTHLTKTPTEMCELSVAHSTPDQRLLHVAFTPMTDGCDSTAKAGRQRAEVLEPAVAVGSQSGYQGVSALRYLAVDIVPISTRTKLHIHALRSSSSVPTV